jgi:hypothetical protein
MKNYRILNACPYCKFCIYEADLESPVYFCNQDKSFYPELFDPWVNNDDTGKKWETSHRVSECGVCDCFEYGPAFPLRLEFYPKQGIDYPEKDRI